MQEAASSSTTGASAPLPNECGFVQDRVIHLTDNGEFARVFGDDQPPEARFCSLVFVGGDGRAVHRVYVRLHFQVLLVEVAQVWSQRVSTTYSWRHIRLTPLTSVPHWCSLDSPQEMGWDYNNAPTLLMQVPAMRRFDWQRLCFGHLRRLVAPINMWQATEDVPIFPHANSEPVDTMDDQVETGDVPVGSEEQPATDVVDLVAEDGTGDATPAC